MNNVDIQECVNDDWKEQLTDKNIVGLVSHGDHGHCESW
jgi:Zn ribbon nucleic-acid-binding protein